ncbi:MAG: PepSY domain-containing protein, partial [Moraxellaceae bacterium]
AQPALAGRSISRLEMSAPNDESATLKITPATRDQLNIYNHPIQVNAITGQVTTQALAQSGMIVAAGTVYGLHIAHVANWPMRWLLFASGILGCCMVGSGMVLWTVKRRMQQLKTSQFHVGHYLVERLNISVIIGLPTAMAGYFLANRLIDINLEDRSALEVKAFFIVWGLLLVHALLRPWAKAWKEQLMLAGLAFAAVPVINLMVTPEAALISTLKEGNWVLTGFDLTMLAFAAVFWIMLGYLMRHQDQVVAKMQQKIQKRQFAKVLAKQQAELQKTELAQLDKEG